MTKDFLALRPVFHYITKRVKGPLHDLRAPRPLGAHATSERLTNRELCEQDCRSATS
jgi:hypothetical protein